MKYTGMVALLAMSLGAVGAVQGATAFSQKDYDLYAGDFDGDGVDDVLFIARDATHLSGITLSDGTSFSRPLQTWGNAYLGVPWSSGDYDIVIGDFDGDGRDDVFLQRKTPGDHFVILTEDGGLGGIAQAIPNDAMGLTWSEDAHRVHAGDFNGDGRADLFLQAADPAGVSAVILSDINGQFTASAPDQSWADGYAGYNWATSEANVFTGDFNGDGRSDLLLQAKPLPGTGTSADKPPVFLPNMNGVLLAKSTKQIFGTTGVQAWSQNGFSAEWSPLLCVVVSADYNGDGRADVLLQGARDGSPSYLLYGRPRGAIFELAATYDATQVATATVGTALAGRFTTGSTDTLFMQAADAAGSNTLSRMAATGVSVLASDVAIVAKPEEELRAAGSGPLQPGSSGGGPVMLAALAVTSAGRTPGQYAVSAMGGATYQIPLWAPPGARGIQPELSVAYMSGGPDGVMGPGWNLQGLSAIARCNKTYAANGGAPAPVTLTLTDDFCMDGNRMRVTVGSYGAAGSQYQTEMADFSRITANGTAGNGPSYFVVEGKDGKYYEYGNTADSKAYANAGTTPYGWLLNKVRDREGNNMTITYSTTSGDVQPSVISYTQTPATGTTYPYTVNFSYQTRVTNLNKLVASGSITQTKVLSKVDVKSGTTSVRQYLFSYETAPTTQRDRLVTIQECGGSLGTDCLRPTNVGYQNGTAGVPSPGTATGSGATNGTLRTVDIDGDGKQDLLFATTSGANYQWWVQFATAAGYGSPINTGVLAPSTANVMVGNLLADGRGTLLAPSGGTWYSYRWNGTSFVSASTGLAVVANLGANQAAIADGDGDGRPDLWLAPQLSAGNYTVSVYRNQSTATTVGFSTTATATYAAAYTGGIVQLRGNNSFPGSSVGTVDVNGDGRSDVLVNRTFFGVTFLDGLTLNGSTISVAGNYAGAIQSFLPVRWNDDACTDSLNVSASTQVQIATCQSSGSTVVNLTAPISSKRISLDWDGDGRSDVLYDSGGTWQLQRSLSTGATTAMSTGIAVGSGTWAVTDRDGDGLSDLAFANASASYAISVGLHNGAATPADLATSITDGWGIQASSTYAPITQSNYTKGTGAVFPDVDLQAPLYVVSQSSQSDGTGNSFTNSYWYNYARVNLQGRGFSGFYSTRSLDSRNGLIRYTYYRQDYPYTGRVFQDDVVQPDDTTLITRTSNVFAAKILSGADCNGATSRCFPYVSQQTTTQRELTAGAPLIQTSVTTTDFDNYGNPLTVVTTTTDNDSTSPFYNTSWSSTVTNAYTNDTTYWCLGQSTSTSTTNTAPGQTTLTRRVDHTYTISASACRVSTETVEPLSTTLKVTTNVGYDGCGNVNSVSVVGLDKNGVAMPARTTTSSYGTRCTFAESTTNSLSQTATAAYNYNYGVKSSETDPNGISVSWSYDNFGRKSQENRPDGTYSTWGYYDCASGPCWGVNDLRFRAYELSYASDASFVRGHDLYFDGLERLRYVEGQRVLGVWTDFQIIVYDAFGRKYVEYQPLSSSGNGSHWFSYDWLNRPTLDRLYNSSDLLDRSISITYAGLKATLTDARGYSTTKWSDVTGKLRRIIDPAPGGTTDYTFDAFGNLLQSVDATGKTISNVYNIRGFKTSTSDPDTGNWTYTPNSLNELVSQTDAKSQVTTFDYDKLGRLISRVEPESTTATTFTYGTSAALKEIGRLKTVSKPDGYGESYLFDSIGRQSQVTYTEDTSYQVNFSYNSIGAVDVITYPTSTSGVRFALKHLYSYGALYSVKDNAAGTVFWSLSTANDYSAPTSEVLGNGATITSSYTPWTNDIVTRQVGTGGSTTNLQNLTYQWDLNHNLTQRKDLAQSLTEDLTYDTLNRIDTVKLNSVQTLSMTYDAAGNITNKSDVGAYNYTTAQTGCSYYTHVQPHAVRAAGSTVMCYDQNGNVVKRGGSPITWYSYNQPQSITSGTNSTQFNYNANHQRWKQIAVDSSGVSGETGTTTTYYVGGLMEKVTRPSGITEYRHMIPTGSGMAVYTRRSDATNSTYYVTTDHLGSGDLILSSTATVLAKESFSVFGERRGSNWQGTPSAGDKSTFSGTTRRGFTGHEMLDAVSLVHMNGRVYDPKIGRFLSADPIIQTIELSQALNPFSYVMNNPLSLVDPSGFSWLSKLFKKIGKLFRSFVNFLKSSINVIIGVTLIVVGYLVMPVNPALGMALKSIGSVVLKFPVHVTRSDGRWGFQVTYKGFSGGNGLQLQRGSVSPFWKASPSPLEILRRRGIVILNEGAAGVDGDSYWTRLLRWLGSEESRTATSIDLVHKVLTAFHLAEISLGVAADTVQWGLKDIELFRLTGDHVYATPGSAIPWGEWQIDWSRYDAPGLTTEEVFQRWAAACSENQSQCGRTGG
ncbi:MAG: FG-GAP-like repeat-containing protein [Steroidobacteraceae bacterium]